MGESRPAGVLADKNDGKLEPEPNVVIMSRCLRTRISRFLISISVSIARALDADAEPDGKE
jgi:hypothetical protein